MGKRLSMSLVGIVAAFSTSACTVQRYHVPPGLLIRPGETPAKTLGVTGTETGTFIAKFLAAYDASYGATAPDATKARELTKYGMTLIDARCDLFFEQIGRGAQTSDFARREFQSLTAALVAALGLTSIGKDAITGVGIGSAFGLQTIDNYSTVYFFSPDVSSVQQLVRRAFTTLRAGLLAPSQSPTDFDGAIQALRTYQNVCTAHEIKRLVTQAIDEGQAIAQYGNDDSPKYAAAADRSLSNMGKALNLDNISLREAVLLQMLFDPRMPVLDEQQVDYVCATLSTALRDVVCTSAPLAGSNPAIDSYTRKAIASGPAGDDLKAGWATLRVLIDDAYAKELDRQQAVLKQEVANRRATKLEKAGLEAKLRAAAAKSEADKKELRDKLEAANDKLKQSVITSTIVSEQASPTTPVTGVAIQGGGVPNPP